MDGKREQWRAAGLCTTCGSTPPARGSTCARCKREAKKRARERHLVDWLDGSS